MHHVRSAPATLRLLSITLAAMLLLGGCASKTFTITFDMQPENTASVRVLGNHPFVLVTNNGPGEVHLLMQSRSQGVLDDRLIGSVVTGRTLRGGGLIEVTSSMRPTRVRIEASSAEGVSVEQSPRPTRMPAPTSQPDTTEQPDDTEADETTADEQNQMLGDDLLDDLLDDSTGGATDPPSDPDDDEKEDGGDDAGNAVNQTPQGA